MGKLKIGCVADDFTGASDWASFFSGKGISTVLFNGIPQKDTEIGCAAAVIALKSRTAPVQDAVEESLRALQWLRSRGTEQIYLKYCSTFDCRRDGNIGPVADAFMEEMEIPYTILCPALPVNGRTVKSGRLYVNGVPLEKSPMQNHPLTPMWDSSIPNLMREQTKFPVHLVEAKSYRMDREEQRKMIESMAEGQEHCYFVPDYYEDSHGKAIVDLFGGLELLTGGSGISCALAEKLKSNGENEITEAKEKQLKERALLLAGSCSAATLAQVEQYRQKGGACIKINPGEFLDGRETKEKLWEKIVGCEKENLLVYSSESPDKVKKAQELGCEKVARLLEDTMAYLAKRAVDEGRNRIIVAGGETSGAVTKALGYCAYLVGESIAPGVPVLIPVKDPEVRLVLKSGNFGDSDFFSKALEMTGRKRNLL